MFIVFILHNLLRTVVKQATTDFKNKTPAFLSNYFGIA